MGNKRKSLNYATKSDKKTRIRPHLELRPPQVPQPQSPQSPPPTAQSVPLALPALEKEGFAGKHEYEEATELATRIEAMLISTAPAAQAARPGAARR